MVDAAAAVKLRAQAREILGARHVQNNLWLYFGGQADIESEIS
jgi:hypothetical protein